MGQGQIIRERGVYVGGRGDCLCVRGESVGDRMVSVGGRGKLVGFGPEPRGGRGKSVGARSGFIFAGVNSLLVGLNSWQQG